MEDFLKIYIIAGEPSGDYLGSRVIKKFLNLHPNVRVYGIGGDLMQNIEVNNIKIFTSLFSIKKIAIMGFIEVLLKIFKLKRLINDTSKNILAVNPDIIITIDSLGFNKRVIKKIKPFTSARLVHLVAPTVWAWKPNRVFEIAKLYDHLLCLFEFELKYFRQYLPTTVVGHPIVEVINNSPVNVGFIAQYRINSGNINVLLMPGSRLGEIERLLPIFIEVVKKVNLNYSNINFILPTISHLLDDVKKYIQQSGVSNITTISNVEDKYQAFKISSLALVASGTATLELSLYNVTSIVAYKVNWLSALIARMLIKIKYASIINIIANKEIIKEFIQKDCTVNNLYNEVVKNIENPTKVQDNKEVLNMLELMGLNKFIPSERIVNELILILNNKKTLNK